MSNFIAHMRAFPKARTYADIILGIVIVLCIGTVLGAYAPHIPWYSAVTLAAFVTTLGISGQLVLFLLVYKGWERWPRKLKRTSFSSFGMLFHVLFSGYIRSLWFFLAIILILSFFHASLTEILRTFAFLFMGINIFITFLSSNPRSWNENTDVPTVLGIGYGIQLVFLLLVKLIV